MSIIVESFPIVEATGKYSNLFKGFVENLIEMRFQDESSCSISNNSGTISITTFTDHTPSAGDVGKTLYITNGVYAGKSGLVTGWNPAPLELEVDIDYISATTLVSWYLKEANMRMSYRFCDFTTQDDQTATNLFDNDFTFYPDTLGRLYIDISLISSLMKPDYSFENAINTNMSKVFQVQYKTVYDNSSDTWHSAHDSTLTAFVPFISIHAGGRVKTFDIAKASPDADLETRVFRGYDKIFSSLLSSDNLPTLLAISFLQYNISKTLILNTTMTSTITDGLYNTKMPTLSATTRYVRLSLFDDTSSYFASMTVYDNNQDVNEYYLTWISELGTIRNWLFTNKIEFSNKAEYDILQDTSFRQIPKGYSEQLTLQAKGISKIEKDYLYDMYLSNKIKIENDSVKLECIVSKPSFSYENRSNSYICTIEVELIERALMNV